MHIIYTFCYNCRNEKLLWLQEIEVRAREEHAGWQEKGFKQSAKYETSARFIAGERIFRF